MFVVAGGIVHARLWLDLYRHVPASVPGAAVVRVGFPVNAAMSIAVASLLLCSFFIRRRLVITAIGLAALFEATALGALVLSRLGGGVLGWMEGGWNESASQTLAVELGALVMLGILLVTELLGRGPVRPVGPAARTMSLRRSS